MLDTASNTVAATIPMSEVRPAGLAFTPDGKHAYVSNRSGSVLVLDTATKTVVATVPMRDSSPWAIAFASDGRHAYVTTSDTVAVLDTATNAVVTTVPVDCFHLRHRHYSAPTRYKIDLLF